jgi:putative transposase
MKAHQTQYPIKVMPRVLNVSACGYYKWLKHKPNARQVLRARRELAIKAAHIKTHETYGYQRLREELARENHHMSQYQVRTIRKAPGIRCKQVKKFKATTNSAHNLPVYDNLLNQTFKPTRPHEAWVSDITYIATDEGWLYCAGIKDVFTLRNSRLRTWRTHDKRLVYRRFTNGTHPPQTSRRLDFTLR